MHSSCTHELNKKLKIYECAECGALQTYFSGGDRGEPPFEHTIPAAVVAQAREGQLDDFARELPKFRNGAFWLEDSDWRRILRSVHRDEGAWSAAFEAVLEGYDRDRWTKVFRDAKRDREAKRRSYAVGPEQAARLVLKDAAAHEVDELDDGFLFSRREGSLYTRWRKGGSDEFAVEAAVHRSTPRVFGERSSDGQWRVRRFLGDGTQWLSDPIESWGDAQATAEGLQVESLTEAHEALHLRPRPRLPIDENALPSLTQVRDAGGRRVASWLANSASILRTDEGWVVTHEHVGGQSHPLTLRAFDTFSVIARSAPGPWIEGGRVVRAEVGPHGQVETPGPTYREVRRWHRVENRFEPRVVPRTPAPPPPLPMHVGGGLYRDDERYGFVEDGVLTWTEPGSALRVSRDPRHGLLFTEGDRQYRRIDLVTGARGPWHERDPEAGPRTACGAEGVIITCPNTKCMKMDSDGVSLLAQLPFRATPTAYFPGSSAVLVTAIDDFAKQAVAMPDGTVVEIPKKWKWLNFGSARFGPVFASGRDEAALLGPWP